MQKNIILLLAVIFSFNYSNAQKYLGLVHSNFGATQGTFYNPAKLAQNRNKFSLELFAVNVYANNNVYDLKKDSIVNGNFGFTNTNNTKPISFTAPLLDVHLPNIQFNIKNKIGIGVSARLRVFNQANDFNPYLIDFYKNATTSALPTSINDSKGFNFSLTALSDVGVSAGINVLNTAVIDFNIGATARMYRGIGYFNFKNTGIIATLTQGTGVNPDLINVSKIDFDISSSAYDIDKFKNGFNNPTDAFNTVFKQAAGKGVGGDIGAELILKSNKDNNKITTAYTPYKIKIGASIQDIGALKYNDVKQIRVYKTNNALTILNSDSIGAYSGNLQSTRAYLKRNNLNADSSTISVTNKLPTTLNVYGDFAVTKKVFITAAAQVSLVTATEKNPYYYNQFSIIPRIETKGIDVALPISYNTLSSDVKLGAAFRLGPLSLGSDDLSLLLKDSKGGNFYFNLHLNVNKKKKHNKAK